MTLGELWEGCAACCVCATEEREIGGGDLGGSSALVGGCRISTARVDGEFRSKGW